METITFPMDLLLNMESYRENKTYGGILKASEFVMNSWKDFDMLRIISLAKRLRNTFGNPMMLQRCQKSWVEQLTCVCEKDHLPMMK